MTQSEISPEESTPQNDQPETSIFIPSAREGRMPRWLLVAALLPFACIIAAFINDPVRLIFTCGLGLSCILISYSLLRIMACLCRVSDEYEEPTAPASLPTISLLLPVYKEAHMIDSLIRHVLDTDYPKDKLDIMIVCEPDDLPTIAAANAVATANVRTFITKGAFPHTKPNALNNALPECKGDIITVYDAEDRPDPRQLHHAARALQQDPRLAVVQAPLTYYNASKNWLTRQFTLEYDALFRVWLPFLTRLGLPFPLGGTSNHIRRSALEAVGGWDAYNVTEDADLSFRLAAYGWKLGYITPPTYEEAVSRRSQWIYQRSRWMKGYMQTWMTHMKNPLLPGGAAGLKRAFTLQLTLGITLLAGLFHVPGLLIIFGAWMSMLWTGQPAALPNVMTASLLICYGAGLVIGITGAIRSQNYALIPHTLFMPLYWLALLPPTVLAVIELRKRPFHWNKTEHGDSDAGAKPNTQPRISAHATRT